MTFNEFWTRFWSHTLISHYEIRDTTCKVHVVFRWDRLLAAAGITR